MLTDVSRSERQRVASRKYAKKRRERDREAHNAKQRAWRAAHPGYGAQKMREFALRNRHKLIGYKLKATYGISIEQYDEMLLRQHGCCGICGLHQDQQPRRMAVDHNHATKQIRMLLCVKCNFAIGHMNDDHRLAARLYAYLKKFNAKKG